MSILKVARLGRSVLRKIAAPVSVREIQAPTIQRLIDDMIETIKEYDGVGLAADQVHESKQIAVLEVAEAGSRGQVFTFAIPLTSATYAADRRIVEAQKTRHLHLAIPVVCNSFRNEWVSRCFAAAPL
jgi:peptide deformylase